MQNSVCQLDCDLDGLSHVELVCGGCGEYPRDFFNDRE